MDTETTKQILGLGYPDWGDILVAISLIGAAVAWLAERAKNRKLRHEELQWKRTEFIFETASLFDGDNQISEAVKIITANNVKISVEDLLNPSIEMEPHERGDGKHKLDKLLNLMERIAYAFKKGVLTKDELSHFEWYFLRVKRLDALKSYCSDYYPDILAAANSLDEKTADSAHLSAESGG